jgi:hypothetical protein
MLKRFDLKWIPVVILIITLAYSTVKILTTDYIFTIKQYLGIAFTIITLLSVLISEKAYKYLLGITLILGTFNVLAFTVNIRYYSFGLSLNLADSKLPVFGFGFQVYSFVVLIIFLIIFRKSVKRVLRLIFKESEAEKKENENSMEAYFMKKFSSRTSEELQRISTDKRMAKAAVSAAKKLLEDRNKEEEDLVNL